MRSLIFKAFIETRALMLACSVLVFVFTFVYVRIIMTFKTDQLRAILDQLKNFEHWLPVEFQQIASHTGRIGLLFDDPTYLLCFVGFAISRGSAAVSGEIGRGTMEMLVSQPITRRQIMVSQAVVSCVCLALIALTGWLGTTVGIYTSSFTESIQPTIQIPIVDWKFNNPFAEAKEVTVPLSQEVSPLLFVPSSINAFSLGVCLYGLTVLVSSFDRFRWRTIGVVLAVYLTQIIIKVVGVATQQEGLARCSFMYAYEPQKILKLAQHKPELVWAWTVESPEGATVLGPLSYDLILLTFGLLSVIAATWIFQKRDIPAPH